MGLWVERVVDHALNMGAGAGGSWAAVAEEPGVQPGWNPAALLRVSHSDAKGLGWA